MAKKKIKSDVKRTAPKYKVELVKSLAGMIEKNNTLMFASIKSLPTRQFQKIKKGLSEDTIVFVSKKNMLIKAIEQSKKNNIKNLKEYVKEDIAILLSQSDAFELSAKLADSKVPVKAKTGQIAEYDIIVEPGPTDMVAGPVVSELGAVGLKIEIKGGKIEIKEQKVLVKKGGKISEAACGIMSKLNIMPFSVGFIPLVAYDSKEDKVFTSLIIDKAGTLKTMKELFSKSMAFAVSRTYACKETIGFLLAKASSHEKALSVLVNDESKEEVKKEAGIAEEANNAPEINGGEQ